MKGTRSNSSGTSSAERARESCLIGGGELAQSLLQVGLVDRIGLNVHPILLAQDSDAFRDPGHR